MSLMEFGRVQMRIMLVLWEKGRATAREITRALNDYEPIVFKNVQTLLRALEKKGAIAHEALNRSHVYYPLIAKENALKNIVHDMIDRHFGGSAASLVSSIIKERAIPPEEFEEIAHILREKGK